jgi:hypothetical protein
MPSETVFQGLILQYRNDTFQTFGLSKLTRRYQEKKRRIALVKKWLLRGGLGTGFVLFCYLLPSLWQGWGALSPAAKDAIYWYASMVFMVGILGLQFGIILYQLFWGNRS